MSCKIRLSVTLIIFLAAFVFMAIPVSAAIDAVPIGVVVDSEVSIVLDINRGIDTGARRGNAPFELELLISYTTADNIHVSITEVIPIKDTKLIDTNGGMVGREVTIISGEPFPPPASDIDVNIKVVSKTPSKRITLAESQSTCSPVTFSCTQLVKNHLLKQVA